MPRARVGPVRYKGSMANNYAGAVLNFPATNGWAGVGGNWNGSVSTGAATFEAWIKTTSPDSQTIVLGSDSPGATPRISVGGDRLSVYWNTSGQGPGWTSADTTPVTDGQWHHVAVVFDQGAMTFYKDGIATADQLTVGSPQQAAGNFQLGAGFGATTGFVGQLYDVRVWSVARTAQDINSARWQLPVGSEPGLTVATSFNASKNNITNLAGGAVSNPNGATVVTAALPFPTFVLSLGGGADDRIWVASEGFENSSTVTFECWLRMSSGAAATRQALMWTYFPGQSPGCLEYLGDDLLGVTWQGQTFPSTDTRVISDGGWHHVALVVSNGVATLYKDGVATADVIQLPATRLGPEIGVGSPVTTSQAAFNGELHQIRIWNTARTTAQISGFRYVPLSGPETGLALLAGFEGSDPASPAAQHPVNLATSGGPISVNGNAAAAIPTQLPQQPLPTNVWTFPTPGEEPVAPSLSPQGTLCIQNTSTDSYLHCVDLETGQTSWTYDPAAADQGRPTSIIPSAVEVYGQQAFLEAELQTTTSSGPASVAELHLVDLATGTLATPTPTEIGYYAKFLTRPVAMNGMVYVGVAPGNEQGPVATALMWAAISDPSLQFRSIYEDETIAADAMTAPVADLTNVYVAITKGTASEVVALPISSTNDVQPAWHTPAPAAVTADLVVSGTAVFVPAGGTIVALSTADGSTLWSHQLSGSPVTSTPVLLGSTLYAGSTDGVLYALDAATGAEQWRVDTGSAITTDLINEFGVLYFANAGSGTEAGPAPAFLAVDTGNQGQDVLTYPVPGADTILLDRAGVTNGVAYFYGAQNVYAVNMSNVLHEFSVSTKLIVEDYDTTGSAPVGNNTSYRVTLTIVDENGFPRISQAVKFWSSDDLYVVNQGTSVTLTPDQPVWMQTDTSGNLTLALSAYDDGSATTGTPNVACPALFAWSNFMPAGESIVIYPDHESLTSLSSVQGPSSSLSQVRDGAPAPLTLQEATGYDGQPLILSSYNDANSLTAIAATVRNTVGAINPPSLGAGRSRSRRNPPSQRYVRAGIIPNVRHILAAGSPDRPYVSGAVPNFTIDLSSGTPAFSPSYDPSPPSTPASGRPAAGDRLGIKWSDFDHFVSNVVKGAESVAKMAWQATENGVATVIHTVEKDVVTEYDLAISDLKDAVTAVTGFFKSVVADIKKVVQWLSALFSWDNIIKNHNYLKQAISNPTPTTSAPNPGMLDQLITWVSGELAAGGSNVQNLLSTQLAGQSSAAVGSSAEGTSGQTVQSQQGGNNDPNAVYNVGGNNNSNQCQWMHQKVNENSTGATISGDSLAAVADSWDPSTITAAWDQFMVSVRSALSGTIADLPEQIQTQLKSTTDTFKDPKSLLSTGLSDLMLVFQTLADDMVEFAERVAVDFLTLMKTVLSEIGSWLSQPVSIPFVSDLYHLLTGDQLSMLDLSCLIAAVPGTILLDVLTGSPTVPDTVGGVLGAAGSLPPDALKAIQILLGVGAFVIGLLGMGLDIYTLGNVSIAPQNPTKLMNFSSLLDCLADLEIALYSMAASFAWSEWGVHDWMFWLVAAVPPFVNLVFIYAPCPLPTYMGPFYWQVLCDVLFATVGLVMAAVYAHKWPENYLDTPKAKGLVLAGNIFSAVASMTEVVDFFLDPWEWLEAQSVAKIILYVVGDVLGFTSTVLSIVDPPKPS
jgi:outer membrane protein assembly factor BamB